VPQTKAAPRLREAIQLYLAQHNEELDGHARKLLTRLDSSDGAADAFERLKPKDDDGEAAIVRARQSASTRDFLKRLKKGNPQVVKAIEQQLKQQDRGKAVDGQTAIIRACIGAENLARTFPKRLKKLEERLERLKPLGGAATMLRGLLNEISREKKHPDPLLVRGPDTDEDIKAMGLGLALFERRIFFERDLVGRNLSWLKVTNKSKYPSKTLSAGQIAAMKLFAGEVKRITGKAHEKETRSLLKVLLGTEVSPEQARDARRANEHWQWTVLSLPEEMRKLPKVARSRGK
jgi:hypothetical protein